MTLHINESEVRQLLIMPMAIAAVEEVSRKQAEGSVVVHPRRRFELPGGGFFHYMAAMDTGAGLIAMKQYTYVKGKLCFLVSLYSTESGELLALIEADYLGQMRTGAAAGGEQLLAQRIVDHRVLETAAHLTGDRHREHREAVQKIGGAIERVDDPKRVMRAAAAALLGRVAELTLDTRPAQAQGDSDRPARRRRPAQPRNRCPALQWARTVDELLRHVSTSSPSALATTPCRPRHLRREGPPHIRQRSGSVAGEPAREFYGRERGRPRRIVSGVPLDR